MILGTLWFVRLFTLNDLDATGGDYYLTTLQEAIVDNVLRQNPFNKLVRWCPDSSTTCRFVVGPKKHAAFSFLFTF